MFPYDQPDATGHFRHAGTSTFGGSFVSETLVHALDELKDAYAHYRNDPEFVAEYKKELAHFVGRPSPIYHAERLSRELGGAQIYLKREDLNHTGAHKINNVDRPGAAGASRMGKPRVIAETGAGQHGVATATICARYGLECVVYMDSEDVKRQSPNVYRMKLLGATVVPVDSGSKDAQGRPQRGDARLGDQRRERRSTSSAPWPARTPTRMMVRDFQRVIGDECLVQMPDDAMGRQPDAVIACVGGGSNAIGIFYPYIQHAGHAPDRRRGGGGGHRQRQARRHAQSAGSAPACCTATAPTCCRTRTARSPRRIRSRPGSTTRASVPSMPT